jgi:hypothetical protein
MATPSPGASLRGPPCCSTTTARVPLGSNPGSERVAMRAPPPAVTATTRLVVIATPIFTGGGPCPPQSSASIGPLYMTASGHSRGTAVKHHPPSPPVIRGRRYTLSGRETVTSPFVVARCRAPGSPPAHAVATSRDEPTTADKAMRVANRVGRCFRLELRRLPALAADSPAYRGEAVSGRLTSAFSAVESMSMNHTRSFACRCSRTVRRWRKLFPLATTIHAPGMRRASA